MKCFCKVSLSAVCPILVHLRIIYHFLMWLKWVQKRKGWSRCCSFVSLLSLLFFFFLRLNILVLYIGLNQINSVVIAFNIYGTGFVSKFIIIVPLCTIAENTPEAYLWSSDNCPSGKFGSLLSWIYYLCFCHS